MTYEPGYNEYRSAPETSFEHSLLYQRHDSTTITTEEPSLFGSDSLVLPLVDGDLSRSDVGTASVTLERLEESRTETTDGTVLLTLPTAAPERWNESVADRSGATVVDGSTESVTIALDVDEVTVYRVGVGGEYGPDQLDDFGSDRGADGGDDGTLPGPSIDVTDTDDDRYEITADNLGTETDPRGGVPITNVSWEVRDINGITIADGANRYDPTSGELIRSDTLDLSPYASGRYDLTVTATDTRGIAESTTESIIVGSAADRTFDALEASLSQPSFSSFPFGGTQSGDVDYEVNDSVPFDSVSMTVFDGNEQLASETSTSRSDSFTFENSGLIWALPSEVQLVVNVDGNPTCLEGVIQAGDTITLADEQFTSCS